MLDELKPDIREMLEQQRLCAELMERYIRDTRTNEKQRTEIMNKANEHQTKLLKLKDKWGV